MADMINELDFDVPPGSELWLFNNVPMQERATKLLDKGNKSPLKLKNLQALPNPDDNRSAVFDCGSEGRSTSCFILSISNGFQYRFPRSNTLLEIRQSGGSSCSWKRWPSILILPVCLCLCRKLFVLGERWYAERWITHWAANRAPSSFEVLHLCADSIGLHKRPARPRR